MKSFFEKLFGRDEAVISSGADAFLSGRSAELSAADVDPENAVALGRYQMAMAHKAAGKLAEAASLLEPSCAPPSIYKGHYRELFKIWRTLNRDDLKTGNHVAVAQRVQTMIRFDDQMIEIMLRRWGDVQGRTLPKDYFDGDRNLRQTDLKALISAAKAVGDSTLQRDTEGRLVNFLAGKSGAAPN